MLKHRIIIIEPFVEETSLAIAILRDITRKEFLRVTYLEIVKISCYKQSGAWLPVINQTYWWNSVSFYILFSHFYNL